MADRLVELQEDVRKKERHAMFGRIAIGLVHDLSHPIQTLGNNSKLMLKMWDDPEFRETFKRTIERELAQVRRVLDDLRHVAKPTPVEHFPIDINKSLADLVDSMATTAANSGLSLITELTPEPIYIEGDLFALNRIYRNLIMNAIQATNPRGRILVRTLKQQGLQLEDSQLENAERLIKLTAIAARAACTIMQLVQARDGQSAQPAKIVFSPPEIQTLHALLPELEGKTALQKNPHPPESLAWAGWIIAKLGGWDGYPKSKPPGPITFRHGLEYFKSIAHGWRLRNV